MTLPERMIAYRAKENISQTEMAKRCGVTLQTINTIETGVQSPSKLTLAKIENLIGKEDK